MLANSAPWLTVAAGLSSFAHFGIEQPIVLRATQPAGPQVEYRYGARSRTKGWDYKALLRTTVRVSPTAAVGSSGKIALMFDDDVESTIVVFRRTSKGVRWEGGGVGGRVRGTSGSLSFSVEAKEFMRTQTLVPGRHRFRAELSVTRGMEVVQAEVNRGSGIFPTRQPDQPLKVSMACAEPVGQGARTIVVRNVGRVGTGPVRITPMSVAENPGGPLKMSSIAPGRSRTLEIAAVDSVDLAAVEFAVAAAVGSTIARCPGTEVAGE